MTKTWLTMLCAMGLSTACAPAPSTDGDTQSSIIGGTNDSGDPSVVQVIIGQESCSGSVISPTVVLTAAHCAVSGGATTASVIFGAAPAKTDAGVSGTVHFNPAFDIHHYGNGNDVAVVVLAAPTMASPLPFNRDALPATMVGTDVRLVGYGVTDTDGGGGDVRKQITVPISELTANHFKVGSPGHTACSGDSGGPAFAQVGGAEKIIGLTSYGTDDNCANGITYYLRIDTSLAFIDAYLNGTAPTTPSTPTDPMAKPGATPTDPGKASDPGKVDDGSTSGCDPKDPGCK